MFLDLVPTCRKCMHPKDCAAPTQERIRSKGGLGQSGSFNHSAMLMTRVKQVVGWRATPDPVSHGDVGGGMVVPV